jgi:hypothetical protein
MSYELSVKRKGDTLYAKVTGTRTLESVLAASSGIMEVCVQENARKVLIDVRELRGRLRTIDSFRVVSEKFPQLRLDHAGFLTAAAIVDLKEAAEDLEFFETLSRNRGFNVGVFGDVGSAEKWLAERGERGEKQSPASPGTTVPAAEND